MHFPTLRDSPENLLYLPSTAPAMLLVSCPDFRLELFRAHLHEGPSVHDFLKSGFAFRNRFPDTGGFHVCERRREDLSEVHLGQLKRNHDAEGETPVANIVIRLPGFEFL